MRDFSFVDETIDLNRAHSYRLSIQFSLNGFSFSILDLIRGKYVALKHRNLEQEYTPDQKAGKIQEIFNSDPCLQVGYKKVMVLVVTPKSVLIPTSYFKQKDLIQYFKFNFDLQKLDEIHFNYLQDIEAYNIFSIPNPVSNVITANFNNAQFYQQGLPLISYYINNAHGDNTCSALSINEDFIDIAVFNRSRLYLYNSYYWSAYDDIIYYLLYVYKQQNLEVSENELHMNGDMENRKELKNTISQYLKKIHYHKPPSEFTYSYTFTKDKSNHFTNLFRLNLCV